MANEEDHFRIRPGRVRDLAGAIMGGDIDPILTRPGLVLAKLLARDSIPSAWGDRLAGLVVLAFSARSEPPDPRRRPRRGRGLHGPRRPRLRRGSPPLPPGLTASGAL